MSERTVIRLGIPTLLLASTSGALAVSLHATESAIPSFAFGSHAVLAIQLALLFFYAALLLLVPVVRALTDGELPIELSLKGARWSESIDDLGDQVAERLAEAEGNALAARDEVKGEIEELHRLLGEITETVEGEFR